MYLMGLFSVQFLRISLAVMGMDHVVGVYDEDTIFVITVC